MTTCTQPSLITSSVTGSFFGCAMSPMSEDSVKNLLYPRVANILAQKNLVATMRWDARTENVTNRITNDSRDMVAIVADSYIRAMVERYCDGDASPSKRFPAHWSPR